MEILTPELIALENLPEVSGSATDVFDDIDFGVRFPLATMLNKAEITARGVAATLDTDARHQAQLISGLGQETVVTLDDVNSPALCTMFYQSVAIGTVGDAIWLASREQWDWTHLPPEGRPITVDGFSAVAENTDGSTSPLLYFFTLRYQIVRLTAEEFASRRAALPSG